MKRRIPQWILTCSRPWAIFHFKQAFFLDDKTGPDENARTDR